MKLYALDDSWWGLFQRCLPEYEIEVSLIAWFDGIKVKAPDDRLLEIMLHNEPHTPLDIRVVTEIANVMMFDFLVDGKILFIEQKGS